MTIWLILLLFLSFDDLPPGNLLLLKNGKLLKTKGYSIEHSFVVFLDENGNKVQFPLKMVDVEGTEAYVLELQKEQQNQQKKAAEEKAQQKSVDEQKKAQYSSLVSSIEERLTSTKIKVGGEHGTSVQEREDRLLSGGAQSTETDLPPPFPEELAPRKLTTVESQKEVNLPLPAPEPETQPEPVAATIPQKQAAITLIPAKSTPETEKPPLIQKNTAPYTATMSVETTPLPPKKEPVPGKAQEIEVEPVVLKKKPTPSLNLLDQPDRMTPLLVGIWKAEGSTLMITDESLAIKIQGTGPTSMLTGNWILEERSLVLTEVKGAVGFFEGKRKGQVLAKILSLGTEKMTVEINKKLISYEK